MPDAYDLIVLGTGSAASKVASRCREAGWRVLAVGERPFGGTCAPHAEEAINLFALAIHQRLPAEALRDLLTAYPSSGSNVSGMLQ